MKLNSIFCSMAALTMMGSLVSCQNGEDVQTPEQPGIDLSKGEKVSLSIKMPDSDLRTRSGQTPDMTYGDDGLFSFSRDIDHLWYAVYNKGTLLYHSMQPGIPQAVYDADNDAFTLDIQIPNIDEKIVLKDYSVFFFAGNLADKVANSEITDGIGLDFENKTVYAYPTLMNKTVASGEYFNPQQYDYFARYTTLDKVVDSQYSGTVSLIRPFCQVSLLSDELCQPTVLNTLSSDGKVLVETTPSVFVKKNSTTSETLPYAWNYDTDKILTKDLSSLSFTLMSRAFNNVGGDYSIPQEVNFKDRKMFCFASFLMLAPTERKAYADGATQQQFSFSLSVEGNRYSTDVEVAANMPAGGIKANEKYVVYNKMYDPNDPNNPDNPGGGQGGGGGLFSTHYVIDVIVDPNWQGTNDILY